jgi:hypothetical protein
MKISREALLAAASAGVLQYRQIEPLLVFLLQHDLLQTREAMLEQKKPLKRTVMTWLRYIAVVLALVTACMFLTLVFSKGWTGMMSAPVVAGMLAYFLFSIAVIAWVRYRGYDFRVRLMALIGMASVPLAVLTIHQVTSV